MFDSQVVCTRKLFIVDCGRGPGTSYAWFGDHCFWVRANACDPRVVFCSYQSRTMEENMNLLILMGANGGFNISNICFT